MPAPAGPTIQTPPPVLRIPLCSIVRRWEPGRTDPLQKTPLRQVSEEKQSLTLIIKGAETLSINIHRIREHFHILRMQPAV